MTPTFTPAPTDTGAAAIAAHGQPESRRPVRSYVLRAGRTTVAQQRALDTLGPRYLVAYQPRMLDLASTFGRAAPTVLEIGFGMGEATAAYAADHPDVNLLGCEVHPPGVGALMHRAEALGLRNVRIVQHDAVAVLQDMVAPQSLAAIHLWFPDPWPKKRHHKRRLVQPPLVRLLASRLAPGGRLHCATDWQPYAEQMLAVLGSEPLLKNTADGYAPRPPWRAASKFERRGLGLGHGVWDLVFIRTPGMDTAAS